LRAGCAGRHERKNVLLIGLAVLAATSTVLAALALAERIMLWQIALGAVISGVFFAAGRAARRPSRPPRHLNADLSWQHPPAAARRARFRAVPGVRSRSS
jgi:MFS family permease